MALGPSLRARSELRRNQLVQSQEILSRYSEPLIRAAFDLQHRLYNIARHNFMRRSTDGLTMEDSDYALQSSLWIFGQFLTWLEILRREAQLLDLGTVARTAELQRRLLDISGIFAAAGITDRRLALYRGEQRAGGDIMIVSRSVGERCQSDATGFAEFCTAMNDPEFERWFVRLRNDRRTIAEGGSELPLERAVLGKRALIELIDFLDPGRVRFSDRNERGKIPLSPGLVDIRRRRPPQEVARFTVTAGDADRDPAAAQWAADRGLELVRDGDAVRITLHRRPWQRARVVLVREESYWMVVSVVPRSVPPPQSHTDDRGPSGYLGTSDGRSTIS